MTLSLIHSIGFHRISLWEWKDLGFFLKIFLQILRVFSWVAATTVSLDFQLGENVFLCKLALLQQIFPPSILWAHPLHSEFCKIFIHKAGRQANLLFVRWKQEWGLLKTHFASTQLYLKLISYANTFKRSQKKFDLEVLSGKANFVFAGSLLGAVIFLPIENSLNLFLIITW